MDLRRGLVLATTLLVLLVPARALAWQEAHEIGDDVRVHVDPNGAAAVAHTLRWHVIRGPLKAIDLVNVDASAALEPDVRIVAEDGREHSGHLVRQEDKAVRIVIDEPRALMRGTFSFEVRWHVDLVVSRALVRDGPTWRLTWSAPVASEGLDAVRTEFDFPAAPDEPRPILADTGAVDEAAVSTLRRDAGRDVLELVRPHVARGETVSWTLRVDPRALPEVVDPRLRPPVETTAAAEPDRLHEAVFATSMAGLAVAIGLLVARKGSAFERACIARGAPTTGGLLPLPSGARATLAGLAFAAGVALQVRSQPTAGGILVAFATLAAALRGTNAAPAARGPGRWLALRPDDAFAPRAAEGHWLDVDTRSGRLVAFFAALLVVGLAVAAAHWSAQGPWLVSLDAAVLVPLLVTGRSSQLPPEAARSAAPWLSRAFRRLRSRADIRVVPWGRVMVDGSTVDELRLLVLPRIAMPGVVGIEIGLAWSKTQTGWISVPEILVRVLEVSPAATQLARTSSASRTVPGRRSDERVVRLAPRRPTLEGAVALACSVAGLLTDRRLELPARTWTGSERRVERPAQWSIAGTC
ncbi:MAG: hypothetical protein ACLP1X_21040 [Polyangiaceae bacterium]|jgi:hypothetical protein